MDISVRKPVVVGLDGSTQSRSALGWAIAEAQRQDRPLRLVHARLLPRADDVLASASREVAHVAPELVHESRLVSGEAALVLAHHGVDAALLVIGSRGLGGFHGLLLGSVGVALAGRSPCPLVVVRGEEPSEGPVVVGVDGSERSRGAVDAAFEEALLRHARLVAVHARDLPAYARAGNGAWSDFLQDDQQEARSLLQSAIGECRANYPDTRVECRIEPGAPAEALIHATRGARLVVVGSRGLGGILGPALGSVTHALLHHARCPVLVNQGNEVANAARVAP